MTIKQFNLQDIFKTTISVVNMEIDYIFFNKIKLLRK